MRHSVKYLGVIRANPAEYVQRYGSDLKTHSALPQFVKDIRTPSEVGKLAWESTSSGVTYELEGDLSGFQFVNLEREGLGQYRQFLASRGIRTL